MKKALIIILILVALILLFPIRGQFKDGGSVEYRAILYTVYKVHSLYGGPDTGMLYVEGIIVEFLGHQVYNNTNPHIENFGDSPDLEKNSDTDKETKIVIDRDAVTKIEIKRYRYNASAEETRTVTVTEEASITDLTFENVTFTIEKGTRVAGATFGLFNEWEQEYTKENAYLTVVSDENGAFKFENVPFGDYVVVELEAPEGYVKSEFFLYVLE